MATIKDAQRYRKIYSFFRPQPRLELMGSGISSTVINGLDWKHSVRAATTADIVLSPAPASIDGYTLQPDDRVLVKDQTIGSENGIYFYDAGSGDLVRTDDASDPALSSGAAVYVEDGVTHGGCAYVLVTGDPITVGTTDLSWVKFAGAGSSIFTSSVSPLEAKTIYSVSIDSENRYALELGDDVFFFVSGSITSSAPDDHKALFGGDTVVSGNLLVHNGLDISGDVFEMTGSTLITGSLAVTGSLSIAGDIFEMTGSMFLTGSLEVIANEVEVTGSFRVNGDIAADGGDITTTAATFNLINTTATTLNIGGAATAVEIGSTTGTTSINNNLTVDGATQLGNNPADNTTVSGDLQVDGGDITTTAASVSVFNTVATTATTFGAATSVTIGATPTATTTVRGGTLVGDATTQNVFNTTATTLNVGGAATSVTIGATPTATTTVRGGTIVGNQTTQNVFNTTATTVNAFGAATTLAIGNTATAAQTLNLGTASTGASTYNIGTGATTTGVTKTLNLGTGGAAGSTTNVNLGSANGGTVTVNNNATVSGDLAVNGGDITTTAATFNLLNSSATTVNVGAASPRLNLGNTSLASVGSDVYLYVSGSSEAGRSAVSMFGGSVVVSGSLVQGNFDASGGAAGKYAHAEGERTNATGTASHAEGRFAAAVGTNSHAEGDSTTANGQGSHAEGLSTTSQGIYSHAEGQGTVAFGSYQHAEGKYNIRNNDFSLTVVGNGTGDSNALRSDIMRVNTDSVQVSGSFIQVNSGSSTAGFMGSETGVASSKGPDVFFYVSGSGGTKDTSTRGVALFGGDVVISGTLYGGSPLKIGTDLQITGTISVSGSYPLISPSISGSLTKLPDGTSYLVAGPNILLTSQSNGSVVVEAATIGGTGVAGFSTYVQFNDGGSFGGDAGLTYNKTTDELTVGGDLAVNGGDVTTTSATATVFNTNATNLSVGGAATTLTLGATPTATTTVRGGTLVGDATTQNVFNTTATTLNIGGAATSITVGATPTATTTVRGGTLAGDATTQNVFNTTATTVNAFGAATTLSLGNTATAAQTLNLGTASTGASTYNVGTGATTSGTTKTLNLGTGGAAGSTTNINLGSSNGGTVTINNNATVTNDLAVNGGDITTTSTGTATLFNTNATTVNIGGGATSGMTVGNATGGVTIPGDLAVNGGDVTTTSTGTATLFNTNATTVNIGGGATSGMTVGNATGGVTMPGDLAVNGGDVTTTAATATLFNANATNLSIGGAATAVEIGASTGTTSVNNDLTVDGNTTLGNAATDTTTVAGSLAVNGTAASSTNRITSTQTSFDFLPTNVTSLGIGAATTAVTLGNTALVNDSGVVGTDTYLFISGSKDSKDTSVKGVTMFGGDVVISGTLHGGSPLKIGDPIAVPSTTDNIEFQFDPLATTPTQDAVSAATAFSAASSPISWTHTPVGTPTGVLVMIVQHGGNNAAAKAGQITSITYGGVAMSKYAEFVADGSIGRTTDVALHHGWFLGSNIPTGAQTVQINFTGAMTGIAAAATVTGGVATDLIVGTVTDNSSTTGVPGIVDNDVGATTSLVTVAIPWEKRNSRGCVMYASLHHGDATLTNVTPASGLEIIEASQTLDGSSLVSSIARDNFVSNQGNVTPSMGWTLGGTPSLFATSAIGYAIVSTQEVGGKFLIKDQKGISVGTTSNAYGKNSIALGTSTTAYGAGSIATGTGTVASGQHSFAAGVGTRAVGANQTAVGSYNESDFNSSTLFIVGNGSSDVLRSDILKVTTPGVTMPTQPSFSARLTTTQSNIAVGSSVTVQFGTEDFDTGADYNNGTYTFTAPVTGKYIFNVSVYLINLDTASTFYYVDLVTSARSYRLGVIDTDELATDLEFCTLGGSIVTQMDAGDTAYVVAFQGIGTQQTDIVATGNGTFFSGWLLG